MSGRDAQERAHEGAKEYEPLPAEIPVAEVTVMEDRARIVRRGRVSLPSGLVRLRAEGVAPVASDKTLGGRITSGPKGARLVETRIVREVRAREELSPADPAAIEERLAGLRRRLSQLKARRDVLLSEMESLNTSEGLAQVEMVEDVAWGKSDFDAWRQRFSRIDRRASEAGGEIEKASEQIRDLGEQVESMEAKLAAAGEVSRKTVTALEADIEVETPGEYELELEYVVPGACWRPYHTATLREEDGAHKVSIRCDGCVWQSTGEDWKNVQLLFSTQRPSLGAEPPKLTSDVLLAQRKREEVVVEAREQAIQTTGLGTAAAEAARLPGVDDGGETLNLRGTAPASVPSDGRPYRVELFGFESEAEAAHVMFPELAACAFLQSTQVNRAPFPLLAGPVDLIRQSGLVGRTSVGFSAPDERFKLGWGPESDIRVQREVEQTEPESGMLSSWVTSDLKVTVRISNIGPDPRETRVSERIPVSEVEQVEIAFNARKSTRGAKPDEDGMVVWQVSLGPFGRETLTLSYTLRKQKGVEGI